MNRTKQTRSLRCLMFPLLIAAGTAVNAQAQSIERMRELLQEIQQEVEALIPDDLWNTMP